MCVCVCERENEKLQTIPHLHHTFGLLIFPPPISWNERVSIFYKCFTKCFVPGFRISLEIMTLQPRCEDVETAEGVAITVTGVAQVRAQYGWLGLGFMPASSSV